MDLHNAATPRLSFSQEPSPPPLTAQAELELEHSRPNMMLSPAVPSAPTTVTSIPAHIQQLPLASQAHALASMAASEQRGFAIIEELHATARASGPMDPIADDNWEDPDDDGGDDELYGPLISGGPTYPHTD